MLSGKTTLARELAKLHHLPFVDLDSQIEIDAQKSVSEIFADQGEPAFRSLETIALQKLCRQPDYHLLVAAGGGLPLKAENRLTLNSCSTIFLDTDLAVIKNRLAAADDSRPLLRNLSIEQLAELFAARRQIYLEIANFVVKNEQQLNEVIQKIIYCN